MGRPAGSGGVLSWSARRYPQRAVSKRQVKVPLLRRSIYRLLDTGGSKGMRILWFQPRLGTSQGRLLTTLGAAVRLHEVAPRARSDCALAALIELRRPAAQAYR